jgi:hypothetical protein
VLKPAPTPKTLPVWHRVVWSHWVPDTKTNCGGLSTSPRKKLRGFGRDDDFFRRRFDSSSLQSASKEE